MFFSCWFFIGSSFLAFLSEQHWGFPVGADRLAALYHLCPTLDIPDGAERYTCNESTCTLICNPGYIATGRRRVRCRYNNKNVKFNIDQKTSSAKMSYYVF